MPWRSIITSVPLWALVIAHFGQNWGFYTFLTQLPRYFQNVLHFDIKKVSLHLLHSDVFSLNLFRTDYIHHCHIYVKQLLVVWLDIFVINFMLANFSGWEH